MRMELRFYPGVQHRELVGLAPQCNNQITATNVHQIFINTCKYVIAQDIVNITIVKTL